MPSIELSKLQGVSGARALSESDRAQVGKNTPIRSETGARNAAKPGVSLEVKGGGDAGQPPVDNERVAEIREALRDGTYPLVPTKIADAMIAARVGFTIEK